MSSATAIFYASSTLAVMTESTQLANEPGSTSIYTEAAILKNEDLELSGYDSGEAPREIFDDCDYEYRLTVRAAAKGGLILALQENHSDLMTIP